MGLLCKVDPQTMDTMFGRGVVSLKRSAKHRSEKKVAVVYFAVVVVVVVVGLWWGCGTNPSWNQKPKTLVPQRQVHRRRCECHPLRNEDALALLRSGASDVQMENCELNDVTVIAEALLDKSTAALKLLNLRRNGISGMFGIFATSK